ncbi:hypothetical protein ACIBO5_51250 [Nonomuraea angiospora]|uniref:hypothetical protein n=1 Tax=Nonomuraea angiospora TaxID=46172 RepID=UPI0029B819BC|nr:hypothetical protein [Nonomuraea angiospora]MDX3111721.1 hypothetical protein [Nonomuraea angiospora]
MPTLRKAAAMAALAMTVTGLPLPAAAATAPPAAADFPCPPVLGICAYDVDDNLRVLYDDEADIIPPIVRAANYSGDPWCFYNWFGYGGDRRELAPGQVADDFGFIIRAARRGPCD